MAFDVQVLARRVEATKDPEARAQYEATRLARDEHKQTLTDLMNAKERIGAALLSLAATLEGLPAKIVRVRALDARAVDQLTGDVREELDRMKGRNVRNLAISQIENAQGRWGNLKSITWRRRCGATIRWPP